MQKVVLIGIKRPEDNAWEVEDYLDELDLLVNNLEMKGRFRLVQKRDKPDRTTFVGSGMVEKIHNLVVNESLKAVIFDDELSPSQQRNLEKALPVPVYDRTFVILSIFSERAKTKEGRTQVELARLKYELPRLKKMWSHLGRQAGGTGVRGGEGEKQLEVDRRIARKRMTKLEKELEKFSVQRHTRSKQRKYLINIALVGYTNAGKSTLMNALTKANVEADDRLFVTLDATSRLWHIDPVLKIVLSDTVGFIRKLPHDLVASFRSTLSEVAEADLLFHVVDASHPHLLELMETVEEVIASLLEEDLPAVLVFNKIDALNKLDLASLRREYPNALFLSAVEKLGLDELRDFVRERFDFRLQVLNLFLPYAHTHLFYQLGEFGQVLHTEHNEEGMLIEFRGFKERISAMLRDIPELETSDLPISEVAES